MTLLLLSSPLLSLNLFHVRFVPESHSDDPIPSIVPISHFILSIFHFPVPISHRADFPTLLCCLFGGAESALFSHNN